MRALALLFGFALWLAAGPALGQTPPIVLTYDTTGAHPGQLAAAAAPVGASITPYAMRRQLVLYEVTANAYNSNNWTVGAAPDLNRYVEWGFDTVTPYALDSLRIRLRRSGSGPSSFRIAMQIDGGAFVTVLDSTLPGTDTVWFNPGLGGAVANSSVRFRLYGWNATGAGGTLRIQNETTAEGNRGVVIRGTQVVANLNATKSVLVFSENGSLCEDLAAAPPDTGGLTPVAIPGACVQYTISVQNTGPVAAQAISLIDPLPGTLTLRAAALGPNWGPGTTLSFAANCSGPGCDVAVLNGVIAPNVTATIIVRATVN
jgi:uncharacterized repeat protein (TIGR01451 family)